MSGYKTLVDGEAVEFDIEQSNKGLQAKTFAACNPQRNNRRSSAAQHYYLRAARRCCLEQVSLAPL